MESSPAEPASPGEPAWPAEPPRKTRDELRTFVDDVVTGQVLTSSQVPQDLWRMVFMPIAFGGFNDVPDSFTAKIGVLYGHNRNACSRGVNGFPMFFELSFMHIEDWKIAREAVLEEQKRRKHIPLPGDPP